MILFTCGQKTHLSRIHACGKAGAALKKAGYQYTLKPVKGYKHVPFMYKPSDRDEVRKLSGQDWVPILVLDDGSVVSGSGSIVEWAEANPKS